VGRITIEHVAAALSKSQPMDLTQKAALMDEIYREQPNLLASCLVQPRLGAESDKFVLLAAFNLVNCIAHAPAQRRRAV
jgi:hypothetical protein